jgi:hypothetical protein
LSQLVAYCKLSRSTFCENFHSERPFRTERGQLDVRIRHPGLIPRAMIVVSIPWPIVKVLAPNKRSIRNQRRWMEDQTSMRKRRLPSANFNFFFGALFYCKIRKLTTFVLHSESAIHARILMKIATPTIAATSSRSTKTSTSKEKSSDTVQQMKLPRKRSSKRLRKEGWRREII